MEGLVSPGSVQQIMLLHLQLTLQEQFKHLNGLRFTATKFKSLKFSMKGFTLPYIADFPSGFSTTNQYASLFSRIRATRSVHLKCSKPIWINHIEK
jgi:hypothetical protein